MMGSSLWIVLLFGSLYFLFILSTRKKVNFLQFSVAGRSVGTFLIFASLSATFIGPGMTMSLSREGYKTGIFYFLLVGFYGIQSLITAYWFAPKIRRKFADAYSVGDIAGGQHSHNHPLVKLWAGVICFGVLAGGSIVMTRAGGELLNHLLGISLENSVWIITIIVTLYSFFGGIKASILTDAFQFILFVALIPALFILMLTYHGFSYTAFSSDVWQNASDSFQDHHFWNVFPVILTWFFGEMMMPPIVNRILAAQNPSVAQKASIYAAFFVTGWVLLMLLIGFLGRHLHPELQNSDQLLLELGKLHYSEVFYGVFIVAMIGVVMSTQDSLINTASVLFTVDILGVFARNLSDNRKLFLAKTTTVLIGFLSVIFALHLESVLQGVFLVYSFWAPSMIVVLLCSIYLHKPFWQAALVSMVSAGFTVFFWILMGWDAIFPTICIGMAVSVIGYFGCHFYLKNSQ